MTETMERHNSKGHLLAGSEDFRKLLELRLFEHFLPVAADLEFVKRRRTMYSEILEYRRRSDPKAPKLLAKRRIGFESAEVDRKKAELEFQRLQRLNERSGSILRGTIPCPVAMFPELNVIVFEKLPGRDLRKILWQQANVLVGTLRKTRLGSISYQVGSWLRKFHEATSEPPAPFEAAAFLREFDGLLGRCIARGLSEGATAGIRERVSRAAGQVDGMQQPRAARQGDLNPINILVEGQRIAVVDFEDYCECAPVHEDVGWLTAYFLMMRESPLYSRGAMQVVLEEFLRGYGEPKRDKLGALYRIKAAVELAYGQIVLGRNSFSRRLFGDGPKLRQLERRLGGFAVELLQDSPSPPAVSS